MNRKRKNNERRRRHVSCVYIYARRVRILYTMDSSGKHCCRYGHTIYTSVSRRLRGSLHETSTVLDKMQAGPCSFLYVTSIVPPGRRSLLNLLVVTGTPGPFHRMRSSKNGLSSVTKDTLSPRGSNRRPLGSGNNYFASANMLRDFADMASIPNTSSHCLRNCRRFYGRLASCDIEEQGGERG